MRGACAALMLALGTPAPFAAQSAADAFVARGDSLHDTLAPAAAFEAYRDAILLDDAHYGAHWKAARSLVDVAKQLGGKADSVVARRDSLYTMARGFADRAVALDSAGTDGWFARALVLGQQSRTKGGRERLRFAREIYAACARGLALDSAHSGLHHILGAWHAEVKRLSGFTRFIARTLLGAGFLGRASWDSAAVHLERAVALDSAYLFHRLELAEIYVDMERDADARAQLRRVLALPPTSDVQDPAYRARAAELLARLERPGG